MKEFDPEGFSASSKLNFNTSIGQSPYTSYYENGKLKVAGESFEEIIGSKVSAKSGLNVRMSPGKQSNATPLGETPKPVVNNPQMAQNVDPTTNLTQTETALLSPTEKVIASRT